MMRLTVQQLEHVAAKLTLCSQTLQVQIQQLQQQLRKETQAIKTAQEDLDESDDRLEEIEMYLAQLREDVQDITQSPEIICLRQQELDEMTHERNEEMGLLTQIRSVLEAHQAAQKTIRSLLVSLTKKLTVVKRREQALVLVALRSRLIKIVPRKV